MCSSDLPGPPSVLLGGSVVAGASVHLERGQASRRRQLDFDASPASVADQVRRLVDPITGATVTFEDLTKGQPETLQSNLIMPQPCEFIHKGLSPCAIIRPTGPGQIDAVGAITGFISDGLFVDHPQFKEFTTLLLDLAAEADEARREF